MTADDNSPETGKTVTVDSYLKTRADRLTDDIRKDVEKGRVEGAAATARQLVRELESAEPLEDRILEMMDKAGLDHMDADTAAVNVEAPPEKVRAALENLEQRGELESEPVMYERRHPD